MAVGRRMTIEGHAQRLRAGSQKQRHICHGAKPTGAMLRHFSSSCGGGPTRLTVQLGGSLQGNDSSRASSTLSTTSTLILLPLAGRRRGFLPALGDLGRG
jgi:hypothetical protein